MSFDPEQEKALEDARRRLSEGQFAFVDGGCGTGGSLEYCEKTFALGRGLGFDSSPGKVERATLAGHAAYRADLTTVDLPAKSVAFVSFLDVLEHLPDMAITKSILTNMSFVARDFIFIRHPSFEDIDYLKSVGLKLDWTDWHGHPNMMSLADLVGLFRELGWSEVVAFGQKPIRDSFHRSIVPEDAPRDTVGYDPRIHAPKPTVLFDRTIHSQFDIFVKLNPDLSVESWSRITKSVFSRRHKTERLDSLDA